MVLNHHLSFSDNGWITKVGMKERARKRNLRELKTLFSSQQWDLQEVVDLKSLRESRDTLIS